MFAQVSTEQITQGFGLSAGIVIVGLLTAIGVIFKLYLNEKKAKEDQLLARIQEAKEVNEKLTTPMQEQIDLNKKTYDLLVELSLNLNKKRRN